MLRFARPRDCLPLRPGRVLTSTASVHRAAWKATFDAYLSAHGGAPFTDHDYDRLRRRQARADGVRDFLPRETSSCPRGSPTTAGTRTPFGIGNRKNQLLLERIHATDGRVRGFRRYLALARDAGLARSSCRPARTLRASEGHGLDEFHSKPLSYGTPSSRRLPAKPAPDSFLAGAELLHVAPGAGGRVRGRRSPEVAAGRAGHFGFVVGVNDSARTHERGLREHGADTSCPTSAISHDPEPRFPWSSASSANWARPRPTRPVRVGIRVVHGHIGIRGNLERGRSARPAGHLPELVLRD